MYEPPSAPLDNAPIARGSLWRGFAGGWGALVLGVLLASLPDLAYLADAIDRQTQHELWAMGWPVLFLPLVVLVVRHALTGRSLSLVGALLAVASAAAVLALFLVFAWITA